MKQLNRLSAYTKSRPLKTDELFNRLYLAGKMKVKASSHASDEFEKLFEGAKQGH